MSKFRILSIDGGGVRGVIPARILQYFEETSGKPISQLFDLIVGTSTGGLIALAMVVGNVLGNPAYSAKDILRVYINYSNLIFEKSILQTILSVGGLWSSKYNPDNYYQLLHKLFDGTFLHQAITPVIIPTYSLINGSPSIFRSSSYKKDGVDNIIYLMSDIAAATSAAPTYFPPKCFTDNLGNNYMEIDGGIFANNPEELAITEARTLNPDLKREDIDIISIGTGTPKISTSPAYLKNSGILGWVKNANILDVMMNASSEWDSEEASMTCPNSTRLQITLAQSLETLDNSSPDNLSALVAATDSYISTNKETIDNILKSLVS